MPLDLGDFPNPVPAGYPRLTKRRAGPQMGGHEEAPGGLEANAPSPTVKEHASWEQAEASTSSGHDVAGGASWYDIKRAEDERHARMQVEQQQQQRWRRRQQLEHLQRPVEPVTLPGHRWQDHTESVAPYDDTDDVVPRRPAPFDPHQAVAFKSKPSAMLSGAGWDSLGDVTTPADPDDIPGSNPGGGAVAVLPNDGPAAAMYDPIAREYATRRGGDHARHAAAALIDDVVGDDPASRGHYAAQFTTDQEQRRMNRTDVNAGMSGEDAVRGYYGARVATEDAAMPRSRAKAWLDRVRETVTETVRDTVREAAVRTKRELLSIATEGGKALTGALRTGLARLSWTYIAAVVLIAVPIGVFTLINTAPANGLDGRSDAAGASLSLESGTKWKVPLISDGGGEREARPESVLAGDFGDGARAKPLPSSVHAAARAFRDVPGSKPRGGGIVGVSSDALDALGARVGSLPADAAGGAASHNIFAMPVDAVTSAADGAMEGSAAWRDTAWSTHRHAYAALDLPICRGGNLASQCGSCCISKATHPGANVETFAAKFRYMRSPVEAPGRRLDVVVVGEDSSEPLASVFPADGVNDVQRRLAGFKLAQRGATPARIFVQAMREMIQPTATIKLHYATIHHADDVVDLVECGIKAADGVPSSPFLHADAIVIQRELFRPSRRAALEGLVRQAAALPKRPAIIYLSHCSIADLDSKAWRAKPAWPAVEVPELLGAKYRCASEETALELGEFMPPGGVAKGGKRAGWRSRCAADDAKQRKATNNFQTGKRKKGAVPGCYCDMTEEERDVVQAGLARARRMERQLAVRYNLTFVDTCAAFRAMLPPLTPGSGGQGEGVASSCAGGNGGISRAEPAFAHPTVLQPAFFAHELKHPTATPRGGKGKAESKKVKSRFDWLHYRYEGMALQACLMAHAALVPNVRLHWLPNAPADIPPEPGTLSLPRPMWDPVAVAAAAAAKTSEPGESSPSPVIDVGQGCLLAKDLTLKPTGTDGIEMTSEGWQYYSNDFDETGHTKWIGTQHVGAKLAVQLTHAATAVRITALTSAGGTHWGPNETQASRWAPLGLVRVAIYASNAEARARAVARMNLWKNSSTQVESAAASDARLVDPAGPNEVAGEFDEEAVEGGVGDVDGESDSMRVAGRGKSSAGVGKAFEGFFAKFGHRGRERRWGRRLTQYEETEEENPYRKASEAAEAAAAKVADPSQGAPPLPKPTPTSSNPGGDAALPRDRHPVAAAIIDGCCEEKGCGHGLRFGKGMYQEFRFPPEGHLPPDRYVVEIVAIKRREGERNKCLVGRGSDEALFEVDASQKDEYSFRVAEVVGLVEGA